MTNKGSTSINKYISQTGLCSRREADKMIDARRVHINGIIAKKGNRVEDGDEVTVDGKRLKSSKKKIYLVLNKPPGITCTTDLHDKDNIIDFINHRERIFPIGRLDKASSGLILLTNDGDIVNKILREEGNHEKEYVVTVDKNITNEFLKKMSNGIPILGTKTKKCKMQGVNKHTFRITLTQGLNRQIRRMCEFLNYKVITLKRLRMMNISLGRLPVGNYRELTKKELKDLNSQLD